MFKQDDKIVNLEARIVALEAGGQAGDSDEQLRSTVKALESVVQLQSEQISALTKQIEAAPQPSCVWPRTPSSPSVGSYIGPCPSAPQLSYSGRHMSTNRNGYIEWLPLNVTPAASMSLSMGPSDGMAAPHYEVTYHR